MYSNNFCGKNEKQENEKIHHKNTQNKNTFKFIHNQKAKSH